MGVSASGGSLWAAKLGQSGADGALRLFAIALESKELSLAEVAESFVVEVMKSPELV